MLPKWVTELSDDFEHDETVVDEAILSLLSPPRSPDILFERLYTLGLSHNDLILDVGCGSGRHALRMVSETPLRVLALDPSPSSTAVAAAAGRAAGARNLHVIRAAAEALPLPDGVAAAVWCRDMLYYVDLSTTLREFARALRPQGHAVIYHTFATKLMEPLEAQRLYGSATVHDNMAPPHFESCSRAAGFRIIQRDMVGSEWRELLETGDGPFKASAKLLRAARLLRGGEGLRRALGEKFFDDQLSDSLWGIYQMLGKLRPTIYVLRRD